LLLLEVNWISVILCTPKLVSTQLDSYFCIIEERVLPEGYKKIRCFFSPLFEGGRGGDLLFIAPPNAHKKTAPAFPQGRSFLD
jgi:hypothetical protein